MKIKSLMFAAVLATALLCFSGVVGAQSPDKSALIAQLQAQIDSLMAQIQALQNNQTPTPNPTPTKWCYSFNTDFGADGVYPSSADLTALLIILDKEDIYNPVVVPTVYSSKVSGAIKLLQKKYAIRASGWVGPVTRQKLNTLYACSTTTTTPTITVTSPNGGEVWAQGSSQTIRWTTTGMPASSYMIARLRNVSSGQEYYFDVPSQSDYIGVLNSGIFYATLPSNIPVGQYRAEVKTSINGVSYLDASDSYFSITASTTCVVNYDCASGQTCVSHSCTTPTQPSITVISPNGGASYGPNQLMNITWATTGNVGNDKIAIYLQYPDGGTCYVSSVSGSNKDYTFTPSGYNCPNISKTISSGNYKVWLLLSGTGGTTGPGGMTDYLDDDFSDNYFTITATTPQPTAILSFVNATNTYTNNLTNPANSYATGVITFKIQDIGGVVPPITEGNVTVQICNSSNICTSTGVIKNVQSIPSGLIWDGGTATVTVSATATGVTGYVYFKISEIDWVISGVSNHQVSGLDNYKTPLVNAVGSGTVCTPNWQTGTWGTCASSFQTRTVTDANNCNVTTNKPITYQYCTQTTTTPIVTTPTVITPPVIAPPPAVTTAPSITLTSPNGGESWQQGTTHNITWTSANIPAGGKVTIQLIRGTSSGATYSFQIAENISVSANSYSWTIPTDAYASIANANDYEIQVFYDLATRDYSDNQFAITTSTTCGSANGVAITTAPTTGFCVNGTASAVSSNTSLNSWTWNCTGPNNGATVNCSASKAVITITSPNGGESWVKGTTHNITWTSVNVPAGKTVVIGLIGYNSLSQATMSYQVASGISAAAHTYSWKIPTGAMGESIVPSSNYKISIGYEVGDTYDHSDNYFTITSTTASTSGNTSVASISDALANLVAQLQTLLKK